LKRRHTPEEKDSAFEKLGCNKQIMYRHKKSFRERVDSEYRLVPEKWKATNDRGVLR